MHLPTRPTVDLPRLEATHDDDRYLARMGGGLADKERLIELVDDTALVVDVGCADGRWMASAERAGVRNVVGIDPVIPLVRRTAAAGLDARRAFASQVHEVVGERSASTVVASSVLHEVFSYGNATPALGLLASVDEALASFARALRPGGTLIVRDGVMPDEPRQREVIEVADDEDVERFLAHSPFTDPTGDRVLRLDRLAQQLWAGDRASVMELALTLNWGPGSFEREVAEWYGVYTLHDYARVLARHGFEVVHADAYTQQPYVPGVAKYVRFTSGWFPHTNAVWVCRRR